MLNHDKSHCGNLGFCTARRPVFASHPVVETILINHLWERKDVVLFERLIKMQ